MADILAGLLQPTRYTTWRPSWRLHLAHMVMALGVTFVSIAMTWPLSDITVLFGIAGVLAVARLNGAVRGTGRGSILSAYRADRLADQPREEGGEEVEGHP